MADIILWRKLSFYGAGSFTVMLGLSSDETIFAAVQYTGSGKNAWAGAEQMPIFAACVC